MVSKVNKSKAQKNEGKKNGKKIEKAEKKSENMLKKSNKMSDKSQNPEKNLGKASKAFDEAAKDPRFAKLIKDPRFKKLDKESTKVEIDERFQSMISNGKEFGFDTASVDKYGRPLTSFNKTEEENMKHFYRLESSSSSSEDEHEDVFSSDSEDEPKVDLARGIGVDSSSDSEFESASEGDKFTDNEEETEDVWELQNQNVPRGEMTRRLAVVNMDWDHIKAEDIFKVFETFVPASGKLLSVNIYPSEFGKERLKRELVEGPAKETFEKVLSKKASTENNDLIQEDDGEAEVDQVALRRYELERLRYYYAIAECDSVATASAIYKACDGSEFESSSNFFDLRFVPDEEEFDSNEALMSTKASPASYSGTYFQTLATQHSNIKLSWDTDEPERVKLMQRHFKQDDLKEMDFKAYIGSGSESSDGESSFTKAKKYLERDREFINSDSDDNELSLKETPEQIREKYRALLEAAAEGSESATGKLTTNDDDKDDLQVSFVSRLEDEDSSASKSDSDGESAAEEASKEELELLFGSNGTSGTEFDMKQILKMEKAQGKNGKFAKRKLKQLGLKDAVDSFDIDVSDKRFESLYSDHQFSLDPTHSNFKKTRNMKKVIDQRKKRQKRA